MRFLALLCSVALWSASVPGQADGGGVTGVVGVNDYTINNVGSGLTSCVKVNVGPGPIAFKVTAAANAVVVLLFSPCPCAPCSWPLGSTCALTQTLDLSIFWPLFSAPSFTDASGTMNWVVPIPPCVPATFLFSTQAVILDPTCGGFPFRLTQAFDVCC